MKYVYRTTWKYWMEEDGTTLLGTILMLIWAIWMNNLFLAGILLLYLPIKVFGVYKLFLSRLETNESSLRCFVKGKEININWSDIFSVQLLEKYSKPKKALLIGTTSEFFVIEIDLFDHRLIWSQVQKFAPPASLEKDAQLQNPAYQSWAAGAQKLRHELTKPFQVSDHWIIKSIAWSLILFSIIYSIGMWISGDQSFWIWSSFSLFSLFLGIFLILNTGTLQVSNVEIIRSTLLGKYQIRWDEISYIEQDIYGSLVLHGLNKYLTISDSVWWAGKEKVKAAEFLFAEISLREIEVKQIFISFKIAKNTKIRSLLA